MTEPVPQPRELTAAELTALDHDGAICVRGVLDPDWLARLARGVEAVIQDPSPLGDIVSMPERGFASDLYLWLRDDDFRSLVFDSPLAALAGQAMDTSTVIHWYDQLFVKEPGADVPTPWHHDLTFWAVDGHQIVSIWIPLDPVTRESGGLEYVRGSHRWSKRFKARTNDLNEYMIDPALDDVPDIDANRNDYDLLGWEMEPGDVLVFHPLVVHGSAGNSSPTTRRRAVASRWAGPEVVYDPKPHTAPLPPGHGLEPGDPLGGRFFPTVLG
ncbi:MAG: phytanoyl-CoA dioxygenase family protein [Acidimicrobiales bacterium]